MKNLILTSLVVLLISCIPPPKVEFLILKCSLEEQLSSVLTHRQISYTVLLPEEVYKVLSKRDRLLTQICAIIRNKENE